MQKISFISNKILLKDKRINTRDGYKASSQQQLENQKHVEIQERTRSTLPKARNRLDNKCKKMVKSTLKSKKEHNLHYPKHAIG
jgi:hypothetical protein